MNTIRQRNSSDPQSEMVRRTYYNRWRGGGEVFTTPGGSQYEYSELKDDKDAVKSIAKTFRNPFDRLRFERRFK